MKNIFLLLLLSIIFANSSVIPLTDENFESTIKEHNQTIVMFHAPWCGACKQMEPFYSKIADTFKDKIMFTSIDTDEQTDTSTTYNIESLPTTIIFKNGKEIRREVGSLNSNEIKMFIDPTKMLKEQHIQCIKGNSSSCIELANFYEEHKDYNRTMIYYVEACKLDADACSNVADIYYYGKVGKKDYSQAAIYYEKSCEGEDIYGCRSIAYMYEKGKGVTKNYKKSFHYYEEACSNNNTIACRNLGNMYKNGLGTEKNITKSIKFYTLACNDDDLSACTNLADLYYDGEEITQNLDKARKIFKQSCDYDDSYGCYSLGFMYQYGEGSLDKNKTQALKYYEQACSLKNKDACEAIKDLKDSERNGIIIMIVLLGIFILFIVLFIRQKKVILENKELNKIKNVPFLFSWTMLIFSFWVPLLRADFVWFILLLILSFVTGGFGTVIFAFFYNKMYIKDLLTKGYEPVDNESKALLDSKGIKYGFSKSSKKDLS